MNCHQVLSGACNSGDQCFAVGSVEGIPFTAYAAGCNIVILASNFERVQIIPGAVHGYVRIGSLDCSTDTGKIAAAYGAEVCVFEPTPLIHTSSSHGLEYRWVQTGKLTAEGPITALSWNLEGTRLLTGGDILQLWHQASLYADDNQTSNSGSGGGGVTFQIGGNDNEKEKCKPPEDEQSWICVWKCQTATPTYHLAFSPDGTLFATSGVNDRLVKIWYHNKILLVAKTENPQLSQELNYEFIYVSHPRAVTHLSWRKTSKYMPKGSVGNVLVTSCVDNICRVWAETLLPDDDSAPAPPAHARRPHRRRATTRHKHRFVQRLKHMKACFHIRRTAQTNSKVPGAPIPTLPSTYSVHDFHNPYHTNTYSAGLHFHLAASINAETDIPLVPSIRSSGGSSRFILHWLNNKEMHFTAQAEALLRELTKKILDKEEIEEANSLSDTTAQHNGEADSSSNQSHPSLSNTTSVNSISTDVTCTHLPDSVDAKIEALLRDWHQSPDLMFSIHPVDGSFLIWVAEWLDETGTGSGLRQTSVSFSARIPAAFPLGDATTMRTMAHLYHTAAQLPLTRRIRPTASMNEQANDKVTTPLACVQEEKEESEPSLNDHNDDQDDNELHTNLNIKRKVSEAQTDTQESNEENVLSSAPVISMVTNHNNGTLNLWQLTFDDKSKFTQVLSIGHASRASGHRFRVNDITCHPVLPLLLTTSHHNISDHAEENQDCAEGATDGGGLCSELILWRVEAVGPLGKSGGVSELARVSSPHLSAFSNVAWIPTLLPSSTLGNLTNSPSACFVASDGESLRVYQAVIDARTLLAEIASSERKYRKLSSRSGSESSLSSDEDLAAADGGLNISIVSQQSTARPGAVLKLHAIADATHDWHNTQLLHVFQKRLITGEGSPEGGEWSEEESGTTYHEPFYIVVLERTSAGTTVHMWQLTVSSHHNPEEELSTSMMYVPDCCLVQEDETESRKNSVCLDSKPPTRPPPTDHLHISTTKVCECPLALPPGVEVIHAAPAAGHLSSASVYPACLAPYIVLTACSDSTIRFWKCEMTKHEGQPDEYSWHEWEMANEERESSIDVPGQPLNVAAAYSGRVACAYKCGRSFTRTAGDEGGEARYVNLSVCVYECESSGGAEWTLEDTIPLRNVTLPRVLTTDQLDLSFLHDSSFMQKRRRVTQFLQNLSSHEEMRQRNTENNLSPEPAKSTGLLTVPSFSTLQSLRKSITENGNTCPLTQKHLVQLDWVSKEDGSHILTVAVGSKVLLFTPVSSDLAQANLKAMKESMNNNRPILRKASSLAAPMFADEIRWMKLRKVDLRTADGLPPLPMQISWVRDGILVVGMDSEMHVYSQWKPEERNNNMSSSANFMNGATNVDTDEAGRIRELRDCDLIASSSHLQRVSSVNLQLLDRDSRKRRNNDKQQQPLLDYMPDYGLFEASQMACPVLPQYHPKQLMELLNSGKIRWVKAILAHLVRCIGGSLPHKLSQGDEDSLSRQRGWSRSRTLSVSFAAGAGSPLDAAHQITEEVQLDYAEITSIPPLPLWTLLIADQENASHITTAQEAKDYKELFDGTFDTDDDLDDLLMEEDDEQYKDSRRRRPSMAPDVQGLSYFGPRQGRLLSRLLTHTHLPGLSSLDQMHLLALADTVSNCNADFAERFAIEVARSAISNDNTDEIATEALDDCGLRFLLAMKHYGYLLRCLPIAQRASLQRTGLGTSNIVWAFHSQSQEQLLALIPGYSKGDPKWTTLRELGVGWWVRSPALVRTCMEKVARAAYQREQDPMDAALYYLAMKKKALLWGLFRSRRDEKMTAFFSNNFTEERWRKAALKNAYALLGKQRFEHAAAFFLLGGSLKDALEVLITRLDDFQLAMIVARLYNLESVMPESLEKLLLDEIFGGESEGACEGGHPDPFVRSMALWQCSRRDDALATLLAPSRSPRRGPPQPSAFNFYVYLRTHPMLQCRKAPVSRAERRLYFSTAHSHLTGGCPALALHVLSKLPARLHTGPQKQKRRQPVDIIIETGQLSWGSIAKDKPEGKPIDSREEAKAESIDWASSGDIDWGAPVSTVQNDDLVLKWEDDEENDRLSDSTPPLEFKASTENTQVMHEHSDKTEEVQAGENSINQEGSVDIMAQQLKFIACLKILMEELSTLATGFEVDGGHLRYQLYIWLEREVEALRNLCNYSYNGTGSEEDSGNLNTQDVDTQPTDRLTLHQVLLQEKLDFEAKVQRAIKRKRWLKANERLVRTLVSYCSLQGAGGGGLASVRMELALLLGEITRDDRRLLAPLPLPTSLPLLAAALHANAAVTLDVTRHLQSQAHDMLATLGELGIPGNGGGKILFTIRDLAVALSSCIYQSLCDTFSIKQQPNGIESLAKMSGVTIKNSHLLGVKLRRFSTEEPMWVTTPPNKWPGVSYLRALCARAAEEEDAPRLRVMLLEAWCAVYGALLSWALAARDAHLLYRLVASRVDTHAWAALFGGGARVLLKPTERTSSISETNIMGSRARLNSRLLGPSATRIDDNRPTYREQFVPPACSILTYLLTKPSIEEDPDNTGYDSAESVPSDPEDFEDEEDDDVFNSDVTKERRSDRENTEHSDPDSYSWCVLRVAVTKLAQHRIQDFLNVTGIEMNELATTSPMIHGALRRLAQWGEQLAENLAARTPPQDYISGISVDRETTGPPLNKYRCLLEHHNTPFNSNLYSSAPAKRLWVYLVHQEQVQDVFIRAVFSKRKGVEQAALEDTNGEENPEDAAMQPVRIIHKEQDSIAAFCLNQSGSGGGLVAVATAHEVCEMDMGLLLRGEGGWKEDECEVDLMGLTHDPTSLPDTGFLLVSGGASSTLPAPPHGMAAQSGRGASVVQHTIRVPSNSASGDNIIKTMKGLQFPGCHDPKYCRLIIHRSKLLMKPVLKHKIDNIKRMSAHPTLPLYLTGGGDGSVQLWEWGHTQCVATARAAGAFAKVTRVRFSELGNKFAVADGDGILSLWQLTATTPFFTHQCHSKGINDFAFLGSCSLIATAGHSSESKNVAIWDTLLPIKKACIASWACHEGGAVCVAYASNAGGTLISGGRRGDIAVWDLRTRAQRHRHNAHDSALKCLSLSPAEDKYATGAADGDIKVWSLASQQLLHCFVGEHAKSSIFKHIGQGVSQIHIDNTGRLFSCGADGTMKVRQLPEQKY